MFSRLHCQLFQIHFWKKEVLNLIRVRNMADNFSYFTSRYQGGEGSGHCQDEGSSHYRGEGSSHYQDEGQASSSSGVPPQNDWEHPKKHPPHLRGRSIGLFYKHQHQRQKKKPTFKRERQKMVVSMDSKKEEKIHNLFEDISTQEYGSESRPDYNFSREYRNHINDSDLREMGIVFDQPEKFGLMQNPELDAHLFCDMQERGWLPRFKSMQTFRAKLPAFCMKERLIDIITKNQVVVVMGETGCGKTTQVPQFILDSFIESQRGSLCKIVCTQPRRISAISVAERVADERAVPCGNNQDVGYQIRLESKMPREQGSMLFCTTGVLLQKLRSDPFMSGISHVIVDEVHERNLDSDFLLISLRDIIVKRKDLKVILMSATLNAREFSAYYGNCPMIEIPGYTFPVEVFMLEDMIEMTHYSPQFSNTKKKKFGKQKKLKWKEKERIQCQRSQYFRSISHQYSPQTLDTLQDWDEESIDLNLIVEMMRYIHFHGKEGAVLVFLPGWVQINKLNGMLSDDILFRSGNFLIIPLHSLMPTLNQKEVFKRPPSGIRKIILATNIAETSITIDDIVYVIDGGQIKLKTFDHEKNIQSLQPEWVALSNMKQREGRAGRTQAGICYHMFTKLKQSELEPYQSPEMLRTSLEETILKIKILKLGKVVPFLEKAMNPPNAKTVALSLTNLERLNALKGDENLTPLGYHLARLPMDPNTGKMILFGAIFSCLDPILSIAASLSFKDAFLVPLGKEKEVDAIKKQLSKGSLSDHLTFAYAIKEWEDAEMYGRGQNYCWSHYLSFSTIKMLKNLKVQYTEYLRDLRFIDHNNPKHPDYNLNSDNILLIKAIVCAGLYPNVAKVKNPKKVNPRKFDRGRSSILKAVTDDGQVVCMHPKSVNASEPQISTGWVVYHLKVKSTEIFLHDTTAVTPFSLLFFGGKLKTKKVPMDLKSNAMIDMVSIDNWIEFQCVERKANLVMNLRQELDNFLGYKITNPGVTDWSTGSREGKVLNCIIELITSEEMLTMNIQADCDNYNNEY